MRKVIGAINMTLDGYCDHTAVDPDEEIHEHYADLLDSAGVVLYGRKTYELMKFWQSLIEKPSGEKDMDEFAVAIDKVPKIVFSNTIKDTGWDSAKLANGRIEEVVGELKKESGKDILVGSRSLILQLLKLNLLDEFQLCVHPVVANASLPLFEDMNDRTSFKLIKTKIFASGAVIFYYEPLK